MANSEYNYYGRIFKVAVTSPLSDVVKYTYDKVGNVISKLDEDNLETLYSYNYANKLEKISYADGKTVEFTYNALKQLAEMKDWLGITSIEMDTLGRATKVTDHESKIGYVWDNAGHRQTLITPLVLLDIRQTIFPVCIMPKRDITTPKIKDLQH